MEIHTAPSSAAAIKRMAGHGRESSGLIAHYANVTRDREQNGSLYREQSPLKNAVDSVAFIAEHFQREEDDQRISNDWTFVAMVLDRIFLITFTVICFFGCVLIIFRAPTIYDNTLALGNA
uniref:Neur_chan_memb domain-containing protein n=1 Tax=Meloidogyne hapla TaxID=6305 RepID=A0A1I8BPX1_MELHA